MNPNVNCSTAPPNIFSIFVKRFGESALTPAMTDYFNWLSQCPHEKLDPEGENILIGRQDEKIEYCLQVSDAIHMCPFCNRTKSTSDVLIDHLLTTRRGSKRYLIEKPIENLTFSNPKRQAAYEFTVRLYEERLERVGRKLLVGSLGSQKDVCLYAFDERAECPYCKKVFTDYNGLIDHLLLTHRKSDAVISALPWPPRDWYNEHLPSTLAPNMPLSNMLNSQPTVSANVWNPVSAAWPYPEENTLSADFPFGGMKEETAFLETFGGATQDVHEPNVRTTLTPYISGMQLTDFHQSIEPNSTTSTVWHNRIGNDSVEATTIKTEQEFR